MIKLTPNQKIAAAIAARIAVPVAIVAAVALIVNKLDKNETPEN